MRYKSSRIDKVVSSISTVQHNYDDVIIEGLSEIDLGDRQRNEE